MRNEVWTITDENGSNIIAFTSFLDIDVRNDGQALSYPIEEGGFVNYNKVQSPLDIRVTLATQGTDIDFDAVITSLDRYQMDPEKVFVTTPDTYYGPMTVEGYSYRRKRESGAYLLIVELYLLEVREVQTQVGTTVISRPKNPTSASKVNTGKTQTKTSLLDDILG